MFARSGYSLGRIKNSSFRHTIDVCYASRLNKCASKQWSLSMEDRLQARLAVAPFLVNPALSFLIAEYPLYDSAAVAQRLVEVVEGNACLLSPQDCMALMLLQLEKGIIVRENSIFEHHFSDEALQTLFPEMAGQPVLMQEPFQNPLTNGDGSSKGAIGWTKESLCSDEDIHNARMLLTPLSETLLHCLLAWLVSSCESFGAPSSHDTTASSDDSPESLSGVYLSHSTKLYQLHACAVLLAFLDTNSISSTDDIRELIEVHLAPLCISQYLNAERMDVQGSTIERPTVDYLLIVASNAWVWWELHIRLGPLFPLDLARQTRQQCWKVQWSFQQQVLSAAHQGESGGMAAAARFLRIVSFFLAHVPLLCHLPTSTPQREADNPSFPPSSLSSSSDSHNIFGFLQLLLSVVEAAVRVAREGWGWPPSMKMSSVLDSLDDISEVHRGKCFAQTVNLQVPKQHLDRESFKLLLSMVHDLILQWTVFSVSPQGASNDHGEDHCFGACEATNSTVFRLARTVTNLLDFIFPSLGGCICFVDCNDEPIWIQMIDLVMWMERFRCCQSGEHFLAHLSPNGVASQDMLLPLEALSQLKQTLLSASVRYLFLADAYYQKLNNQSDAVDIQTEYWEGAGANSFDMPSHSFLTTFILVWQEWVARLQHASTPQQGFIMELQRELSSCYNLAMEANRGSDRGHSNLDTFLCSDEMQRHEPPAGFSSTVKPVEGENGSAYNPPPHLSPNNRRRCPFFRDSNLLGDLLLRSWSRCLGLVHFNTSLTSLLLDMTILMRLLAENPSPEGLRGVKGRIRKIAGGQTSVLTSASASDRKLRSVSPLSLDPLPVSVFHGLLYQCTSYLRDLQSKLYASKILNPSNPSTTTLASVLKQYQSLCTPAMVTFCAKWGGLVDSLCTVSSSSKEILSTSKFRSPPTERCCLNSFQKRHTRSGIQYVNAYPHNYLPLWDNPLAHSFHSFLRVSLHAPDAEAEIFKNLLKNQFCEAAQSAGVSQKYFEMVLDAMFLSSNQRLSREQASCGDSFIPCIFCVCGVPAGTAKERGSTSSLLSTLQVASFFIWQQTRKVLGPQVGDVFERHPSVQLFFIPHEGQPRQPQPNPLTKSSAVCREAERGNSSYFITYFNYLQIEYAVRYLIFVLSEAFSGAAGDPPTLSDRDAPAEAAFSSKSVPGYTSRRNKKKKHSYESFGLRWPAGEGSALPRSQKVPPERAYPALRASIQEDLVDATVWIDRGHEAISANVRLFVSSYSDWCVEALWRCLCGIEHRFQRTVEEDWMRTMISINRRNDNASECVQKYKNHSLYYRNSRSYHAYIREKLLNASSAGDAFTGKVSDDDDRASKRWHAVRAQVRLLQPWLKSMQQECFFSFDESTTLPSSGCDDACAFEPRGGAKDRYRSKSQGATCGHVLNPSQARLLLGALLEFPEATFLTFPLDLLRALWDSAASRVQEASLTHAEGKFLPSPEDLDELSVWLLWIGLAECLYNLEEEVCAYVVASFLDILSLPQGNASDSRVQTGSRAFGMHGMLCASPMEMLELAISRNANSRAGSFLNSKAEAECILNAERSSAALAKFSFDAILTYYYAMERPCRGMREVIRVLLMNSKSPSKSDVNFHDGGSQILRQGWYLDRLNMIIGLARQAAEVVMP